MGLIPGSGRPPGEGITIHSSILAWKIPWTAHRVEKESDTTYSHTHTHTHTHTHFFHSSLTGCWHVLWICQINIYKVDHIDMHVHAQSCPTLCNPMDCTSPGSSVYGIFQARIVEWVVISSSRGSSNTVIEPASPMSPALQVDSLPLNHQGSPSHKMWNQPIW